ncbi:MAG: FkbM family methyltransferase [Alphaproteobacteria bacterium GM202ARS2]|nr:FkbM family methyltransferase [Alphaproteobacteria bacterium GM202ARS2]
MDIIESVEKRKANIPCRYYTYGDEWGQVDFLINCVFDYQNNGLPKNGFFVDLACADGKYLNNTFFLEKYLGWKGLLFEVNTQYLESIKKYRTSPLVTDCVTDKIGDTVNFRLKGMLSGIVSDETYNKKAAMNRMFKKAKIIQVKTTRLDVELDKVKAPKCIDFFSLDVEGAEHLVLRSFPFAKYQFRCMTIENPREEIDILLDKHSYRQVAQLGGDTVYVHRDFLANVNLQPQLRFRFSPR